MSIKTRYYQVRWKIDWGCRIISQSMRMRTNTMVIELSTIINAPVKVCFDLSRSIDLHLESTKHTGEKAIGGRTSGLIERGEMVTWRAKHFGVWQNLTSKITEFKSPDYFTDEMVSGAFKSFRHEHLFFAVNDQTVMKDIFTFESPLGWLGRIANILFLGRYMERLLKERNRIIKSAAETYCESKP